MAAAGGASGGDWEILAFTNKPKQARAFTSYNNWSTGYRDAGTWTGNSTGPLEGGLWQLRQR